MRQSSTEIQIKQTEKPFDSSNYIKVVRGIDGERCSKEFINLLKVRKVILPIRFTRRY